MKKAITLVNINAPYELKPSTLMLASPHRTSTIWQMLVYPQEIVLRDLLRETTDPEQTFPVSKESFQHIFSQSHTIIVPDSMLCETSRVFDTQAFTQYALHPLQQFYQQQQGTLIIQCVEGAFGTNSQINQLFGLDWKIHVLDSKVVVATPHATQLLGTFTPKRVELKDLPFFVETPDQEGLYSVPLMDRPTFNQDFHDQDEAFERLGITKDESLTCFNIDKSWENYLEKYSQRYLIAVHKGPANTNEGHIVWYGDRGNSETLAFVFCKMLNLQKMEPEMDRGDRMGGQATKNSSSSSTGLLGLSLPIFISIVVVLVAIYFQKEWTIIV